MENLFREIQVNQKSLRKLKWENKRISIRNEKYKNSKENNELSHLSECEIQLFDQIFYNKNEKLLNHNQVQIYSLKYKIQNNKQTIINEAIPEIRTFLNEKRQNPKISQNKKHIYEASTNFEKFYQGCNNLYARDSQQYNENDYHFGDDLRLRNDLGRKILTPFIEEFDTNWQKSFARNVFNIFYSEDYNPESNSIEIKVYERSIETNFWNIFIPCKPAKKTFSHLFTIGLKINITSVLKAEYDFMSKRIPGQEKITYKVTPTIKSEFSQYRLERKPDPCDFEEVAKYYVDVKKRHKEKNGGLFGVI